MLVSVVRQAGAGRAGGGRALSGQRLIRSSGWPDLLSEIRHFGGLGGPGGPGQPSKMWGASRPIFLKAFPGPRGRPDPPNDRSPAQQKSGQTAFRYPAGGRFAVKQNINLYGFGPWMSQKPYKFKGFGALDATRHSACYVRGIDSAGTPCRVTGGMCWLPSRASGQNQN